uniref:Major vault protein n=1 Tax=Schistocephalus solidus TaxID=70667 RepID=A0A183TDH6_SCHSO
LVSMSSSDGVNVAIPPYHFLHVLDNNTNVTRLVSGPATFFRKSNEKIIKLPQRMITVTIKEYCIISNPVKKDDNGDIVMDEFCQASLTYGDVEYRFAQPPFPLYPGEEIMKEVTSLTVLAQNKALLLSALINFKSEDGVDRVAGEQWLFEGPGVYRPRKEVEVLSARTAEMISPNSALFVRALMDFKDRDGQKRVYGEEWLVKSVGAYMVGAYEERVDVIEAYNLDEKRALHVKAKRTHVDNFGKRRKHGEEWLITHLDTESHIPSVNEEVVQVVSPIVLASNNYCIICDPVNEEGVPRIGKKLLVRGEKAFFLMPGEDLDDGIMDVYVLGQSDGIILRALEKHGEEWLITHLDTESHIPSVNEEVVQVVSPIVLASNNYCIICDPVNEEGVPRIGKKLLVRGEKAFFLMPGEDLDDGIMDVYVLGQSDGIILRALESFQDGNAARTAGEEWMLTGPLEYVPPIEVEVVTVRKAIPLDENEGIYVRDKRSGQVRAVIGSTYLLNQDEELWPKKLSPAVEKILRANKDPQGERADYRKRGGDGEEEEWDPTRVITYRVPHNAAVHIYDYKGKKSRVVFGPERVMLGPDEEFTLLSLSGGKPKRTNIIKTICLLLGPDFCTDVLVVETADHARLSIQLSYNWQFQVSIKPTQEEATKLFSQPDFVGDFCKTIAARVRGIVASVNFDQFHKNSASLIRQSVFGTDPDDKIGDILLFPQNNLVVTSVDVQAVEPVDQRTRDALQKSVQLAIEITSNSQEASARQEAERLDQEARGKLERQRIKDEAKAEEARRGLLELQVELAALESTGQAKAEAQSRVEAALISTQAEVKKARLEAEAEKIKTDAELERLKLAREAELDYIQKKGHLNLECKMRDVEIETAYFLKRVQALGAENLRHIACAGPERDVRMLRALNLKSTLITDGRSPVNLLDATTGLIGQARSTVHVRQSDDEVTATEPIDEDGYMVRRISLDDMPYVHIYPFVSLPHHPSAAAFSTVGMCPAD